jgi:hypothetical protein
VHVDVRGSEAMSTTDAVASIECGLDTPSGEDSSGIFSIDAGKDDEDLSLVSTLSYPTEGAYVVADIPTYIENENKNLSNFPPPDRSIVRWKALSPGQQ